MLTIRNSKIPVLLIIVFFVYLSSILFIAGFGFYETRSAQQILHYMERIMGLPFCLILLGLLWRNRQYLSIQSNSTDTATNTADSFISRVKGLPWLLFLTGLPVIIYLYFFSINAYTGLFLENNDFTNISSALNHTAKGQGLLRTGFLITGSNGSYLGHHFSPILLVYTPFYFLAHKIPEIVLWFQTAEVVLPTHFLYAQLLVLTLLSGFFLWTIVIRIIIPNRLGQVMAWILCLLQPALWHLMISFHFEILVLPLSALLFWALHKQKQLCLILAVGLMLFIKEDMAIYLTFFGLYLTFYRSELIHKYTGPVLVGCCLLYFTLVQTLLIPVFIGDQPVNWSNYWTSPALIPVSSYWKPGWMLLMGSGFLCLFNLRYFFIVLLPILIIHAFSNHLYHQSFLGHYSYTILPFLFYGIVTGIRRLISISRHLDWPRLQFGYVLVLLFCFEANSRDRLTPMPAFQSHPDFNKLETSLQLHARQNPYSCNLSQSVLSPHLPLVLTSLPLQIPRHNYYHNLIPKLSPGLKTPGETTRDIPETPTQEVLQHECGKVFVITSSYKSKHYEHQNEIILNIQNKIKTSEKISSTPNKLNGDKKTGPEHLHIFKMFEATK